MNDSLLQCVTLASRSYVVQTNAPPTDGSYTNNFSDFSLSIDIPGTTKFLDTGGATGIPSRYYRVRLVP